MHRNRVIFELIHSPFQPSAIIIVRSFLHSRTGTSLKKTMTSTMTKQFFTAFVVCCCLLFLAPAPALAQEGNEFAGAYDLSGVSATSDSYLVTLDLEFKNYGVSDVNYGTLTLEDSLLSEGGYLTYPAVYLPAVYLPAGSRVRLTWNVVVPAHLYQEWQKGLPPHLSLQYQAADGNSYSRRISLFLHTLAKEE